MFWYETIFLSFSYPPTPAYRVARCFDYPPTLLPRLDAVLPTFIRMFGLSPAKLALAADCAMFRAPSPCPSVPDDKAKTTAQCMQERISSELHQLRNKEWSSKLPFEGIGPCSAPPCIQHDDILTFYRNNILKGQVFRFSFDLYPPTTEGITILAKELMLAAKLSGGVDLVSGSKPKPTHFANMTSKPQLCCRSCGEIYRNQSKKLNKENGSLTVNKSIEYRKATLHNDRLNDRTRKDNEKLSRRTGTCRRPTKNDAKCPFTLPLFMDQNGFFLKVGLGNPNHQYHAKAEVNKVSRVRAALLSETQLNELKEGERAHIGKAVSRNMFFIRHGILLSTEQIRKIGISVDADPNSNNIAERLQHYFEKENAHCCFLYEKSSPRSPHAQLEPKYSHRR